MEMVCSNCSKSIKIGDGVECSKCECRYHVTCGGTGGGSDQRHAAAGDFSNPEWKCYACTSSTSPRHETNLACLLVSINEKIELINKIQLPKLSTEILHLKNVSDVLAKQNVEILRKIKLRENFIPSPLARRGCSRANATAFRKRNPFTRIAAYFSNKRRRN